MNEWRRKVSVVDVQLIAAGFSGARSKAEEDVSISVNFGVPRVDSNRYVIISSLQGIKRIGSNARVLGSRFVLGNGISSYGSVDATEIGKQRVKSYGRIAIHGSLTVIHGPLPEGNA